MVHFLFDMPLEELEVCQLPQNKPADLDVFWERMLERSANQPLHATSQPLAYSVPTVRVDQIGFDAFDGGRIEGWFIAPAQGSGPFPTLIFHHGYSWNRGKIADYLLWVLQGFACLSVDVRGQGGESTDHAAYPGGHGPGWLTQGILEPDQYYLSRTYVDTVRAIDYTCTRPEVDANRIGMSGLSQGGGLSLAACCLDSRPALCMPEVPAFGHFERTLTITRAAPWDHLYHYLRVNPQYIEPAMATLRYVELNNLAERIQCPTIVSVALSDDICIPSTIYTVYNRIPVNVKELDYFPFSGHDAGLNREKQIIWARRHLLSENL